VASIVLFAYIDDGYMGSLLDINGSNRRTWVWFTYKANAKSYSVGMPAFGGLDGEKEGGS
jgi:hypothetical protein